MEIIITLLIIIMILFHLNAFVLEAFLWQTPRAFKIFGTTKETARTNQTLATNQAVYNLFLAGGLIVSFLVARDIGFAFQIFFLSCITVAALTAGITVSKKIMLLQGTPALLALLLLLVNR